ncbi:MAG: quinone-dependent dihydroorotate dehydrogenase [Rhodobacteraceae bacterium]|nr:quinone-dependent dihydroorotate dehydrogenase [Paracoccaceae bacterium]
MFDRLALSALQALPPETAHRFALRALRLGVAPKARPSDPALAVNLWGLRFAHPIGVAAGFDKNAEAPDALLAMGAAFVEIGAVTPRPQAGNPRPRLFRLAEDRAAINRMGFNNRGLDAIAARLRLRQGPADFIGANLGANKDSDDRMSDYETVLRGLWGQVGFFTVNVSSPNTEKLRDLQGADALTELLTRVVAARDECAEAAKKPPVLVKIAPDLSDAEIDAVARIALETKLDGIVATNTTLARPDTLCSPLAKESGGLSGAPLFERSTEVLRSLRRAVGGQVPLIGVGGVSTAADAYVKIKAGASLVQLYTALAYQGPSLLSEIAHDLAALVRSDGFSSVGEAVGCEA